MAYTFQSNEGQRIYDAIAPAARQDEELGYPLARWIDAWTLSIRTLASIVRDDQVLDRPGWVNLLDPEHTPDEALRWLAQFIGVGTNQFTSAATLRDLLVNNPQSRLRRGGVPAMVKAAQATLTGNKTVIVLERTTSAWTGTIVTRTSETPDAAATLAAIMSQKPAGIIITHVVSDEPIIDEATLTIDGSANVAIDSVALGDV